MMRIKLVALIRPALLFDQDCCIRGLVRKMVFLINPARRFPIYSHLLQLLFVLFKILRYRGFSMMSFRTSSLAVDLI